MVQCVQERPYNLDVLQVILAPARGMWYLLGKNMYVAVYEQLDQMMGLDQLGIKYGGMIFGAVSTTVVAGSLLAIIGHKVHLLAWRPVHAHLLLSWQCPQI